jgi:hypothetical protein
MSEKSYGFSKKKKERIFGKERKRNVNNERRT